MADYTSLHFALLRAPALSGELVGRLFTEGQGDEQFIAEAWRCSALAEVIHFTSADLTEQSGRFLHSEKKDGKVAASLAEGLTRYLLRAALRPTPYGALSGLATVPVGTEATVLEVPEVQLNAVAERSLVRAMVAHLEKQPEIQSQLLYAVNPHVIRRGSQLRLDAEYGVASTTWPAAQRAASAVRCWLTDPSRPAKTYRALIDELQERGSTEDAARRFVDDLITQGFLLCPLRPSQTTPDPLAFLLEEHPPGLPGVGQDDLDQFQTLISAFNGARRSEQLALYTELIQRVRKWAPGANAAIQLMGVLPLSRASEVPARWAEALTPALEALLCLHAPAASCPWPSYVEEFEQRYGVREIPLLEMLDDERGLGPPPAESRKPEDSPAWLKPEADRWLLQLAAGALKQGTMEVSISTDDVRRAMPEVSDPSPTSVDAFVRPRVPGQGAELLLSPVGFLVPSGRALGRFAHRFEDLNTVLQEIAQADEQRHAAAGYVVADLQHESRNPELNGITAHPPVYQVAVSTARTDLPRTHPLSDILVGVRDGVFILRFQSTGQSFVTRTLHALVETEAPAAVRFLQRAGREHSASAYRWHWGSAAQLPRTPRVRLNDVALTLARWQVPDRFCQGVPLGKDFDEWCAAWDVPEWIAVGEFDQKLSLCRTHPIHRRLLLRELARGARHLEELWEAPGEGLLQGDDGRRNVEVVFPLRHKAASVVPPSRPPAMTGKAPPGETRLLKPGGPCLYLKVYGPRADQDTVLRSLTSSLPPELRWFFTRYQDPKHHVRLRVFGPPEELWTRWLPHLTRELEALSAHDLVWSFQIDTYEREVERYGGWDGLLLAEQLFMDDSPRTLQLRAQRRLEWPLSVTLCGSVDRFVRPFLPQLTDRLALYDEIHARRMIDPQRTRRWSTDFGVQRQRLIQVFQDGELSGDVLRRGELAAAYRQLDQAGQLGRPLNLLLPSLIHMHCNRMGADQAQEWLTTFYLKKLLAGFRHHLPAGVTL